MNTCKTCEWWDDDEFANDIVELAKRENNAKCKQFRLCLNPSIGVRRLNRENIENPASALSLGVESIGKLVTGPDFGCIHYTHAP